MTRSFKQFVVLMWYDADKFLKAPTKDMNLWSYNWWSPSWDIPLPCKVETHAWYSVMGRIKRDGNKLKSSAILYFHPCSQQVWKSSNRSSLVIYLFFYGSIKMLFIKNQQKLYNHIKINITFIVFGSPGIPVGKYVAWQQGCFPSPFPYRENGEFLHTDVWKI